MVPQVDFCGLKINRLILGANPFGGYSHQSPERDETMRSYYTPDRIIETWNRAESAGINTMITNNETPHVFQAIKEYFSAKGKLQWIAQINCMHKPNMFEAIDEAVTIGCKALYFHGGLLDEAYITKDEKTLSSWFEYTHKIGVPAGIAGHPPEAHLWVNGLDLTDFHCVPFFNCGSLHNGKGDTFSLGDIFPATECIRRIQKPCIGYKIMGAGRIDPLIAFEYAFERIKPTDVVNVGMFRGDKDNIIEENVALVNDVLKRQELVKV